MCVYVPGIYTSYLTDRLLDGVGIGMEMEMGFEKSCLLIRYVLSTCTSFYFLPYSLSPSLPLLQQPLKEAYLSYKWIMYICMYLR